MIIMIMITMGHTAAVLSSHKNPTVYSSFLNLFLLSMALVPDGPIHGLGHFFGTVIAHSSPSLPTIVGACDVLSREKISPFFPRLASILVYMFGFAGTAVFRVDLNEGCFLVFSVFYRNFGISWCFPRNIPKFRENDEKKPEKHSSENTEISGK